MEDKSPVVAYFDGLCEPNPNGVACGGWVIKSHPTFTPIYHKYSLWFGTGEGMTNNVAEYEAALSCLRHLVKSGWNGPVQMYGDSQLVVKQYTGEFACRQPHLQELLRKLHKAKTYFDTLEFVWIPREQNEEADRESFNAYKIKVGIHNARRMRR